MKIRRFPTPNVMAIYNHKRLLLTTPLLVAQKSGQSSLTDRSRDKIRPIQSSYGLTSPFIINGYCFASGYKDVKGRNPATREVERPFQGSRSTSLRPPTCPTSPPPRWTSPSRQTLGCMLWGHVQKTAHNVLRDWQKKILLHIIA